MSYVPPPRSRTRFKDLLVPILVVAGIVIGSIIIALSQRKGPWETAADQMNRSLLNSPNGEDQRMLRDPTFRRQVTDTQWAKDLDRKGVPYTGAPSLNPQKEKQAEDAVNQMYTQQPNSGAPSGGWGR